LLYAPTSFLPLFSLLKKLSRAGVRPFFALNLFGGRALFPSSRLCISPEYEVTVKFALRISAFFFRSGEGPPRGLKSVSIPITPSNFFSWNCSYLSSTFFLFFFFNSFLPGESGHDGSSSNAQRSLLMIDRSHSLMDVFTLPSPNRSLQSRAPGLFIWLGRFKSRSSPHLHAPHRDTSVSKNETIFPFLIYLRCLGTDR